MLLTVMRQRLVTILLGISLVGLGVFVFLAPAETFIVRTLMHYWPLFLLLAGAVRVLSHLLDGRPRSPMGGVMMTAMGSILLAASLRGEFSLLQILGRYWFWLLLAFIAGRVMRQYTQHLIDRGRPRAFSFGAVVLMLLLIGSGLTASFITKHGERLRQLAAPFGILDGDDLR